MSLFPGYVQIHDPKICLDLFLVVLGNDLGLGRDTVELGMSVVPVGVQVQEEEESLERGLSLNHDSEAIERRSCTRELSTT